MISEESFRLFSCTIRVGHWTRLFPYKWNPHNYNVEVVPHLNWWRVIGVVSLMKNWVMVWSTFTGFLEPGWTVDDVLLFS